MFKNVTAKLMSLVALMPIVFLVCMIFVSTNVKKLGKAATDIADKNVTLERNLGIITTNAQSLVKRVYQMKDFARDGVGFMAWIYGVSGINEGELMLQSLDEMEAIFDEMYNSKYPTKLDDLYAAMEMSVDVKDNTGAVSPVTGNIYAYLDSKGYSQEQADAMLLNWSIQSLKAATKDMVKLYNELFEEIGFFGSNCTIEYNENGEITSDWWVKAQTMATTSRYIEGYDGTGKVKDGKYVYETVESVDENGKPVETESQVSERTLGEYTIRIASDAKVVEARNQITGITRKLAISTGLFIFVFIGVGVVIAFRLRTIVKPAAMAGNTMSSVIEGISNGVGDLTNRFAIKGDDEISKLLRGINSFMDQLQGIIRKIREESANLSESVSHLNNEIRVSNESTANVSAVTQQLAASMQEISNNVDQLSRSAQNISEQADVMNNHVNEGYGFVKEVQSRATDVKQFSVSNKKNAEEMIAERRANLNQAIENSKNVEKINKLTEEILSISSQTNLLALNASIEAARAGEAGKGFAVVADEIRVLADSSRDTANNIQSISKLVNEAVALLSKNADEILKYIDESVLTDYEQFVDYSEQYFKDAESMKDILAEFQKNSHNLTVTLAEVSKGVDNVNRTVQEGSDGIATVAEDATKLAGSMSDIRMEAEKNREISESLHDEVERFVHI